LVGGSQASDTMTIRMADHRPKAGVNGPFQEGVL
jgi:hypothetical protein